MSVIKEIKIVYNDLKPVQKRIADYFLKIDFEGLNNSIEEIADSIGTSVASISRFCKRLGYDSFKRFKITFSRDLQYEPEQILPIFHKDDEPSLSIKKVFSEAVTSLQATEGVVDFSTLIDVAESIRQCEMLYFLGLGGSGRIGQLGEIQLSHLGYRAKSLIDPYEMLMCAGHGTEREIFFCISHSGRQKQVVEAGKLAREKGARIVALTNYGNSALAQLADYLLLTGCHERGVHFAQSNSMVAQLTLIRALYIILASNTDDAGIEGVASLEKIVNSNLRVK